MNHQLSSKKMKLPKINKELMDLP